MHAWSTDLNNDGSPARWPKYVWRLNSANAVTREDMMRTDLNNDGSSADAVTREDKACVDWTALECRLEKREGNT
jgi:hypothetical protein